MSKMMNSSTINQTINQTINKMSYQSTGVKGSDVYSSTGDPRVDLSVMLIRGASQEDIRAGLDKVFQIGTKEAFEDAFVLAFQTRNIRGGKGERDVSYEMFQYFLETDKELTKELLDLLPKYGYWRDLVNIALDQRTSEDVIETIACIFADQLIKDMASEGKISLCAKWAPREGKGGKEEARQFVLVKLIANKMSSQGLKLNKRLSLYRQHVSILNRRIDTTEVKMCSGDWDKIEPRKVPGRSLALHKDAFLNQFKNGLFRYPENEKRMDCRMNFQSYFDKASRGLLRLKAADVMYPHEIVAKALAFQNKEFRNKCSDCDEIFNCGCLSDPLDCRHADELRAEKNTAHEDEKNLIRGQWRALVEKAKEAGALKNSIAMCDFSGSMNGMPKLISLALGMLVSEVNGTNKILTFDSQPRWMKFPEGDIFEKLNSIPTSVGQGLSTDFQAAMDLIMKDVASARLSQNEIPKDLLVFTDMGFDQACGSDRYGVYAINSYRYNYKNSPWQTHLEMIREAWRRLGEDMHGTPFIPPRIVVWNLRANYKDYHATADQEGVVMLSGWSPALFKVLQTKGVEIATPYDALRAQLDDEMYDEVRQRIRSWITKNSL